MGNHNVGQSNPLLAPKLLWSANKAPANPPPASPQQVPTTLPSLSQPDSVITSLPKLPPIGQSTPSVSFAAEPDRSIQGQASQLRGLLKSADQELFNQLAQVTQGKVQLQLVKNPQGQISSYLLNGQPVTQQQVQQSLLPLSGQLHQALDGLKADVQGKYQAFFQTVHQQFPNMTSSEQTSVNIQLQAINVLFESFLSRLNQVDGLIK